MTLASVLSSSACMMPKLPATNWRLSTQVTVNSRIFTCIENYLWQIKARAAIEEEFAKKLLALAKKPLGSSETGTLKASMDILRLEVEGMGKAHQSIASQMKTELEEPLTAFSSTMRERRKIVQGGCEKILKLKMQQTQQVNKVIRPIASRQQTAALIL
jgi:hypothetical protein